jgi:hypothetical protein
MMANRKLNGESVFLGRNPLLGGVLAIPGLRIETGGTRQIKSRSFLGCGF